MKKIYLFAALAITSIGLKAQTLTATSNPDFPDVFYYTNCAYQPQGNTGQSQLWNFSSASVQSTTKVQYTFIHDTGLDFFMPANLAVLKGNCGYAWNTSSTGITCAGMVVVPAAVGMPGASMGYGDNEIVIQYPFSYGSSFTDSWNTTYTLSSVVHIRHGVDNVLADATGTLVTPSNTYNDVIRIHRLRDYRDSIPGNPATVVMQDDEYVWYQPGLHAEVFSVVTQTSSAAASSPTLYMSYRNDNNTVGIATNNAANETWRVYPNPANDKIVVQLNNALQACDVQLFNISGQQVLHETNSSGHLDVSLLPAGVYSLRVSTADKKVLQQKITLVR